MPFLIEIIALLSKIASDCFSISDYCAWRIVTLVMTLPYIILGILAVYKIEKDSKNWKSYTWMFFLFYVGMYIIFEVLPYTDIPEFFRYHYIGLKLWIKFENIFKSLFFLSRDYLNPILVFLSLILISNINASSEKYQG